MTDTSTADLPVAVPPIDPGAPAPVQPDVPTPTDPVAPVDPETTLDAAVLRLKLATASHRAKLSDVRSAGHAVDVAQAALDSVKAAEIVAQKAADDAQVVVDGAVKDVEVAAESEGKWT